MSDAEIFMTESLGSAIIDTACTRTVCGEKEMAGKVYWRPHSRSSEPVDKNRNSQLQTISVRRWEFSAFTSNVKLPAKIGLTKCLIETEVVKVDIPLLLSKTSLKKAGPFWTWKRTVQWCSNNLFHLNYYSGHYCVDIRDKDNKKDQTEEEVLTVTENMSPDEKRKVLLKLHKQFGHASADRLQRQIQSSGNKDKDCFTILQQILYDCEICQKYKRTKPKPAVGLPMASEYKETVAVDLHELEPGVWYLHIIDHFTRFSAGYIVKTNKSSEIVNSFIHTWISVISV